MHDLPVGSSELFEPEARLQAPPLRSARRKAAWALACFCAAAVLAAGVSYGFRMIRAVSVFAFLHDKPRPVRVYDRFFGWRALFTDGTIQGSAGPIQIRTYRPYGRMDGTPIVMIHGLVPYGNRDGYLDAVANNLAEMGYLVILPNVPAETRYEMQTSDLTVIGDTIRWVARKTGQKVSVIGASFGAGLATTAALQPGVVADVKLIFSLSGYYNLDTIGRYYIHDRVYDPYGHPYPGHPPGPLFILSQYLDEMVSPEDLKPLSRELNVLKQDAGLRLTDRDTSSAEHLSAMQQQELSDLETANTPAVHQLYMDVLTRHRQEIAALSPYTVVKNTPVPLYVLHGSNDEVLPAGEVEWMRKDTRHNPNVHILVSPWIGHAVIGQQSSVLQRLKVAKFGADILVAISRPSSLK